MILAPDARIVFQTSGLEFLLRILTGEPLVFTRWSATHNRLPAPILKLLRQITGAANGTSNAPPGMQVSTAYGVLTLEAKWLAPAGTLPEDVARDPKSCLISVTIELREHAIAHAARALRESGATPAQTKVGIQLAFGKTKPAIADELGIQLSSVVDLTKKLYQNSRCSQFRRTSHQRLAGPKARRGAPIFAARRISLFGKLVPRPLPPSLPVAT